MGLWRLKRDNDLPCVGLNGDRYHSAAFLQGSWLPYSGSVMAIDPSGRGSDETAVCVVKMLNGFLYLTAMRAYNDGYSDDTLEAIAKLAKEHEVNHVIIEGKFPKLLSLNAVNSVKLLKRTIPSVSIMERVETIM